MKSTSFIAVIVATSGLLGAGAALAKPGHGGFGPKMSFEELDTDRDGQVTQAELEAHKAARFAETDSNGDGKLSLEEMQAKMHEHAQRRMSRMIERFDQDGDGALSQSELPQKGRHGDMFKRMDRDGSGGISQEEFEEARSRHGKWRKHQPETDQN